MDNKEDYLIHYGVLGMKWGVRRGNKSSSSGNGSKKGRDITKKNWSAEKLGKKSYKMVKNPKKSKNTRAVIDKMNSEFQKTKEYKDAYSRAKKIRSDIKSKGVTFKDMADYNVSAVKANKKAASIAKKYQREYAGALLRDMKYADTKAGRDWVEKRMNELNNKKK